MKIMLRAAMAALSISTIGSAYANDSQAGPDYAFPCSVNVGVQAPVQTQQNGQAIHTFVTQSADQGTYLFPPTQNDNGG